jgi:hypothetical protein
MALAWSSMPIWVYRIVILMSLCRAITLSDLHPLSLLSIDG